jgi:hypothetical protein
MTDRSFKAKRGERVTVAVSGGEGAGLPPSGEPTPGVLHTDTEDDVYVRRQKPIITFYDLGTRLRSVPPITFTRARVRPYGATEKPVRNDDYFNEYVEIEYELPRSVNQYALYTPTEIARLVASLLGSRSPGSSDTLDPLGDSEANVTGRKLHNCQPLPYSAGRYHTVVAVNDDEYRLNDGTEGDTQSIWPVEEVTEWKMREPVESDAGEKWNPHNLAFSNVAHRTATLKPKSARVTSLRNLYRFSEAIFSEMWGMYERFDTTDNENFRITSEPSFAADEVPVSFNTRDSIRVYLVPRMALHRFISGNGGTYDPTPFRWHSRLMVYPDVLYSASDPLQLEVAARAMCFIQRSPLAASAFQAYTPGPEITPFYPVPIFYLAQDQYSPISLPGMLSAVIAQGSSIWYIWRRSVAEVPNGPVFSGNIALNAPCT